MRVLVEIDEKTRQLFFVTSFLWRSIQQKRFKVNKISLLLNLKLLVKVQLLNLNEINPNDDLFQVSNFSRSQERDKRPGLVRMFFSFPSPVGFASLLIYLQQLSHKYNSRVVLKVCARENENELVNFSDWHFAKALRKAFRCCGTSGAGRLNISWNFWTELWKSWKSLSLIAWHYNPMYLSQSD